MNWFQCKISYEEMMEKGILKKVTGSYLVDALSFTEAEARIIEEMKPYITGEFTVKTISRYPVSETFFNENRDRFYKGKIAFITLDEKSGKEKRTKTDMLVQASDIQEAKDIIIKNMADTMADYVIIEIKETDITEVFPYNPAGNERSDN